MIKSRKISDFFEVRSGDYHVITELDPGATPLISCGDLDNGVVGYFDMPAENIYENTITVAYNGRPLTTKFHPYRFGTKDDVAVLLPKVPMEQATLLYVATKINNLRWRYSYGRKCFKAKLENLKITLPLEVEGGQEIINQKAIADIFPRSINEYVPAPKKSKSALPVAIRWKPFEIEDLFTLERGDFHSITALDPGEYATISRVTSNNGLVGYFDKPEGAIVYPGGQITVSTVGGDAFVQLDKFIASDNVIICVPKSPMSRSVLFFIAFILNNQKWRYSYGRQPYKTKLETASLSLPVKTNEELDEHLMDRFVTGTNYWQQIGVGFPEN